MLNLLMAQIWSSYYDIAQNAACLARKHRSRIIIDIESMMSSRLRKSYYEEMMFDKPLPFDQVNLCLSVTEGVARAGAETSRKEADASLT